MKAVQILLSTYNGEAFLREQLDSLLLQTYKPVHIFVRDDGSTDQTREILEQYREQHENIEVVFEKNIGVIPSFLELLQQASDQAGYLAFCDQDDYWHADKIEKAVQKLDTVDSAIPAMYCSRVELVNGELAHIGMYPLHKRGPAFENAVVQNIATGCTIVMNQAARRLLLQHVPDASKVIMHDWWFYLVVSAFGTVIYDPESSMLYRQHAANTVGADHTLIGRWVTRFQRYIKKKQYKFITNQNKEFMRLYGDKLDQEKKGVLTRFLQSRSSLWGRIQYFMFSDTYRQSWNENIICRLVLLLNMV
ncbi:glycosyltransferase family 2 protein [Aneurinibacillus uraniidurans]|uniref:glycosyltransferase family 2 protein n=1 Tax=Aneurinibacillus uraniidurans TaxID=2966586 RepID=UPI00234A1EBD|nr:glycosyltransferase family 2 protein [Aneurinibacillus sp. B1]WCN38101.1 glycosyltransferase family 2 protein [Aneurinibacillus sp. B1]